MSAQPTSTPAPTAVRALALTPEDVRRGREEATATGRRLMEVLEEQSGLAPRDFVEAIGLTLHYPTKTMDDLYHLVPAFDVLPFAEALQHECVLFREATGAHHLVFADPFAPAFRRWAEERLAVPFTWHLAHPSDIAAYLARHEDGLRAMDAVLPAAGARGGVAVFVDDLSLKTISEDTSPVIKLVHSTLYDALKVGASDIHLETEGDSLNIRYRIDGVLNAVGALSGAGLAEQVISRIKVMSELDIAERRIPQDGRFRVSARGREIDFRVSVMPSIFGEDAVVRILDKQSLSDLARGLNLAQLGFNEAAKTVIRRLANEPYGMLLVTGPTGSGKTTTLYATISEINHGADKIITIEDPVEYQLPGVLQIPVNEKKGLTFARGLRSILRHDPDRIMVGEIRDPETAQIAVQAALTGHLVFTTVHANNVFDVIGRFMHMGVDPYSFVSALNGIVAQRLVRVLCGACAIDDAPDAELLARSGLAADDVRDFRFRIGRGCGQCRGTGYRGRKAIAEIMVLTDELRELIAGRSPIRELKEAARRSGTRFLRDSALELVSLGETSLQEINRVTFVA
jgi:general secretion pathway protein E